MNTHLDAPVPDRMLDAVKLVRNILWGQRPTAVSVARERERVEAVGNTLVGLCKAGGHSGPLQLLENPESEQLLAVSALKHHLFGWRARSNFCMTVGWCGG